MAAFTSIAIGVAAAAMVGASVYTAVQASKKPKMPDMPQVPQISGTPASAETKAQEEVIKRKKLQAKTQTVKTSPLGITDEAETEKKKLLGT